MSTVSNLIFNNKPHYVSSAFGTKRNNKYGKHMATDYATYGKKLAQHAIADGVIMSCGCDVKYGKALFVWVKYEQFGVKMLHYHLDRYTVKSGQTVSKGTIIGYTGQTGHATGIHLHLEIRKLSDGTYFNPEKWSSDVYDKKYKNTNTTSNNTTTTNQKETNPFLIPKKERKPSSKSEPEIVWNFLISKIKNPYGVAGLIGNLYCESALRGNNLENTSEDKSGLTDEEYTKLVDEGKISRNDFIKSFKYAPAGSTTGQYGYGLAGWTYPTRKANFYDFWKKTGGSVGNIVTQLEFLYWEFNNTPPFPEILEFLKKTKSVKEASNKVLLKFEGPKRKGSSVQTKRYNQSKEFYDKYKDITAEKAEKIMNTSTKKPTTETENKEKEEKIEFKLNFSWVAMGEVDD